MSHPTTARIPHVSPCSVCHPSQQKLHAGTSQQKSFNDMAESNTNRLLPGLKLPYHPGGKNISVTAHQARTWKYGDGEGGGEGGVSKAVPTSPSSWTVTVAAFWKVMSTEPRRDTWTDVPLAVVEGCSSLHAIDSLMADEDWWYCACKWCCTNNGFVGCYSVFGFVERVLKLKKCCWPPK